MTEQAAKKTWTKPVLVKLGTMKDVAGPKTVSSNGLAAGFANS